MCFNSSKSESKQAQSTVTRDERQAADNGATVVSAKDGGQATTTTAHATTAHTVFSAAPGANVAYQDLTPEVLAAVFDYAKGVSQGAADFAVQTQAAYQTAAQGANTQDSTQIVKQLMLVGGIVLIVYFTMHGGR